MKLGQPSKPNNNHTFSPILTRKGAVAKKVSFVKVESPILLHITVNIHITVSYLPVLITVPHNLPNLIIHLPVSN